jgi:hypothetical protein
LVFSSVVLFDPAHDFILEKVAYSRGNIAVGFVNTVCSAVLTLSDSAGDYNDLMVAILFGDSLCGGNWDSLHCSLLCGQPRERQALPNGQGDHATIAPAV